MADNASITFYDARNKPSTISINVDEITGANLATVQANVDTLATTLGSIGLSGQVRKTVSTSDTIGAPANAGGLRGAKAIIRWFSALENAGEGANGSNEVGCVDMANFTAVSGKLLLQGASYDALKTAFDAVAVTENGNPVSVYEVEFVNRNIN